MGRWVCAFVQLRLMTSLWTSRSAALSSQRHHHYTFTRKRRANSCHGGLCRVFVVKEEKMKMTVCKLWCCNINRQSSCGVNVAHLGGRREWGGELCERRLTCLSISPSHRSRPVPPAIHQHQAGILEFKVILVSMIWNVSYLGYSLCGES